MWSNGHSLSPPMSTTQGVASGPSVLAEGFPRTPNTC